MREREEEGESIGALRGRKEELCEGERRSFVRILMPRGFTLSPGEILGCHKWDFFQLKHFAI